MTHGFQLYEYATQFPGTWQTRKSLSGMNNVPDERIQWFSGTRQARFRPRRAAKVLFRKLSAPSGHFFWTMAYGKVREKGVKNRMASVLTPPRALGTFTTGAYPRLNWLKRMDDDDGWLQAPPGWKIESMSYGLATVKHFLTAHHSDNGKGKLSMTLN